ncbi:MAG TPA: hypothetical protein VEQ63_13965 [Bryobacteraceae bacterium]|nr:hypothetical protein [Bryobacteraceae bacterium]
MRRSTYVTLLRLHPRSFRERFGSEMLEIFDAEAQNGSSSARLLTDVFISLFRQWISGSPISERALSPAGVELRAVPMFRMIDDRLPKGSCLTNGAVVSLVLASLLALSLGRGNGRLPGILIGAKYPRPNVLPVDRNSIAKAEPATNITIVDPPVDPLYELAVAYFSIVRVLKALDANGDYTISGWEIITAASPLRRLDRNRDGELDAQECGLLLTADLPSGLAERAPAEFMQLNPVLAKLDANHDTRISESELAAASAALKSLDLNGDGSLTRTEVLPKPIPSRTAMILSELDRDRDSKISGLEQNHKAAEAIRPILVGADRNGDGVVTAVELTRQLQFDDELKRQHERALRSAGRGIANPQRTTSSDRSR